MYDHFGELLVSMWKHFLLIHSKLFALLHNGRSHSGSGELKHVSKLKVNIVCCQTSSLTLKTKFLQGHLSQQLLEQSLWAPSAEKENKIVLKTWFMWTIFHISLWVGENIYCKCSLFSPLTVKLFNWLWFLQAE